jgi:hypothetical protein
LFFWSSRARHVGARVKERSGIIGQF